ncbi:hypothetical protein BUALT_Bualt16G0056300 [Buddleja alternifolia]|uniref:TTF-type domain-containing protein n=1 Tax=Buddleja alternifolia TaxID=168488 RepID=A0AAV6WK72_9LAMI|nr:hypothetical protein BUALT_Bualt16G0056300 [Buddleja alternifolia]
MSINKIEFYFKKRCSEDSASSSVLETSPNVVPGVPNPSPILQTSPTKVQKPDQTSSCFHIERDPGLRKSIWDYPKEKRDEARRAYLMAGPYQGIPESSRKYVDRHGRRFLPSWYKLFSDWLEYSPIKNVVYCLPCFLFVKPSTQFGANAFIIDRFQSWKSVNDGKN